MSRGKEEVYFHLSTSPIPELLLDQIESEIPLVAPVGEDTVFTNVVVTIVPKEVFVNTLYARQAQLFERQTELYQLVKERLSLTGRRKSVKNVD